MTRTDDRLNTRFGKLIERADGRDFPYYNGQPVEVATWKWLVTIAACALGKRQAGRGRYYCVGTALEQPAAH